VGATIRVGQSTVTGNGAGWSAVSSGVVDSYGDNYIDGNTSQQTAPPGIPRKWLVSANREGRLRSPFALPHQQPHFRLSPALHVDYRRRSNFALHCRLWVISGKAVTGQNSVLSALLR